ncbi:MAG: hypothetical protein KGL39_12875 [Patescibacteria group bacterium]|nr:hypothetical protein [Patescibacteria group bacterium]
MAIQTFQGQVADAIIAAAEIEKQPLVDALTKLEGGAVTAITAFVNNLKVNGALARVAGPFKNAVINQLVALEQKYPGSVLFGIIDAEAHTLAKQIGG